jgi:hypothetical protein
VSIGGGAHSLLSAFDSGVRTSIHDSPCWLLTADLRPVSPPSPGPGKNRAQPDRNSSNPSTPAAGPRGSGKPLRGPGPFADSDTLIRARPFIYDTGLAPAAAGAALAALGGLKAAPELVGEDRIERGVSGGMIVFDQAAIASMSGS